MADTPEAVKKSIRTYLFIGSLLFVFTVVTVAVASYEFLDFGIHGFDWVDAIIGLAIASFKATLVAAVFMHLNHEKKAIYWIFGSGIVFVIGLFGLIGLAKWDPIHDPYFFDGSANIQPPAIEIPKTGG
jgi:caa(3)-type oxidase subunit IV